MPTRNCADAEKYITDWRNCNDGSFKYQPRQGDAVLFWSVTPNQEIDPRALHGGCPVIKGEKWVSGLGRWECGLDGDKGSLVTGPRTLLA